MSFRVFLQTNFKPTLKGFFWCEWSRKLLWKFPKVLRFQKWSFRNHINVGFEENMSYLDEKYFNYSYRQKIYYLRNTMSILWCNPCQWLIFINKNSWLISRVCHLLISYFQLLFSYNFFKMCIFSCDTKYTKNFSFENLQAFLKGSTINKYKSDL